MPGLTRPAVPGLRPTRDLDRFFPAGHRSHEIALAVDHKRSPVEDELVLATDLVDVRECPAGLARSRPGKLEPRRELSRFERRAVRHEEELRTSPRQMSRDGRRPYVFAHGHADRDAPKIYRVGHRSGRKHALLVEDTVVRQIRFETRRDRAFIDDDRGVVHTAALPPGRRGDKRWACCGFRAPDSRWPHGTRRRPTGEEPDPQGDSR